MIKERRERRDHDRKRRNTRNDNHSVNSPSNNKYPGFGRRSDETENLHKSPPARASGAASTYFPPLVYFDEFQNESFHFVFLVAPPPSLQESTPIIPALQNAAVANAYGSSSVAAKIMAKYGFKDGQGLGKKEQGMSIALQVEKTSKRGGRIIHEKELLLPSTNSPSPPPTFALPAPVSQQKEELTITEIMKSPSKVVLLRVSSRLQALGISVSLEPVSSLC